MRKEICKIRKRMSTHQGWKKKWLTQRNFFTKRGVNVACPKDDQKVYKFKVKKNFFFFCVTQNCNRRGGKNKNKRTNHAWFASWNIFFFFIFTVHRQKCSAMFQKKKRCIIIYYYYCFFLLIFFFLLVLQFFFFLFCFFKTWNIQQRKFAEKERERESCG